MRIGFTFLFIFFMLPIWSQSYFSKVYNFDRPNVVFTNIEIVGDTIYSLGIITDNNPPIFNSAIGVFDKEGKELSFNSVISPYSQLDIWKTGAFLHDNKYYCISYVVDTIQSVKILSIENDGVSNEKYELRSPFEDIPLPIFPGSLIPFDGSKLFYSYYFTIPEQSKTRLFLGKFENEVLSEIEVQSNWTKGNDNLTITKDSFIIFPFYNTNINYAQKDFIYQNVIQKRDTNLNLVWEYKTDIDELFGVVSAIVATQDSGVVVSTMEGIESFVNPNKNEYSVKNVVFYKLDENGDKKWYREIVKNKSNVAINQISKLKEIENGNILAAGHFNWYGEQYASLIKLNSEGDSLWQRFYTFPDKSLYRIYDMEVTSDGSIVLAGEASSPQEGWLISVDSMGCLIPGCVSNTSAEEELGNEIVLTLFPNPVDDLLNIQFSSLSDYREGVFTIYDEQGRKMDEWENRNANHFILHDVHNYPAGKYVLNYESKGKLINRWFLVE